MVSELSFPWRRSRAIGLESQILCKIPNPLPALAADRPYSSSASARRPWPPRSIASSFGSGANREACPVQPSSLSGYGGGPNRCLAKVPGIVPGKIPKPALISGKITKSTVVRYEADASDPTAVWQIVHLRPPEEPRKVPDLIQPRQMLRKANYKLDVVESQLDDLQNRLNRMEASLRRLVNSQAHLMDLVPPAELENEKTRRIDELGVSEGNFNFPSNGFSVVAMGWEQDPKDTDEVIGKHDVVLEDFGIPSWLFELSLPTADPIQEPTLVKQWPQSTKEYVSQPHSQYQPRQWNQQSETNLAVVNNPDEAKFDLTQLYVVGRADKRLRCTGLFWKLPPWPDFCTMNYDHIHSVLYYTDKFKELVKIWPFVNEAASDTLEDTIKHAIEYSITWPVRKVISIISGDYNELELKSVGTLVVNLMQARELTNKDADIQSVTVKIYDNDGIQEYELLVSDGTQQVVRVWDPGRSKNMRWQSSPLGVGGGLTFGVVSAAGRAQTLPKSHHYFSMWLTLEYSKFSSLDSNEPFVRKFNNPKHSHYVILSKIVHRGDNANGAIEFCGVRLCQVRNLFGKITYDPKSCAGMSVVNVINLEKWRKHNVTENYLLLLKQFKSTGISLFYEMTEEAYQTFSRAIVNANVIMATYEDPLPGDVQVYSEKGTVAFFVGLHGLAFTLSSFAKMYASKLQSVRHIIYIEDEPVKADTLMQMEHLTTLSFSEVEEFGKTSHTDARLPSSTDTAVIMYTSGSIGLPKGVMITHGDVVATTAAVMTIVPKIGTGDVYLAYHSLAHVFELTAETVMLASVVVIGYCSALTMTDTSIKIKEGTKVDVSVLKSTLMISVPAIMDRIRDAVIKKVGENSLDPISKKWTTKNTGSATSKRDFAQFYYEPIKQIIKICMNDQKDKWWPMLRKLGVTLKPDEKELIGKAFMKRVIQTWLPASNALLEMMVFHFPSPSKTQKHRVENLYEVPLVDIYAIAIKHCDLEGYLMLYVPKMIPRYDMGAEYEELVKAATTENELQFVETHDGDMVKILFPGIAFEEQFLGFAKSQMPRLFEGAFEEKAIIQFVDLNKFSLIIVFIELNSAKFSASPIKLQVFTLAEAYEFEDLDSMLQEGATGFNTKVMFIYVDNLKFARIDASVNEHPKLQKLSLKNMMRFIKDNSVLVEHEIDAGLIRTEKSSVSPVVHIAVNANLVGIFVLGLKMLLLEIGLKDLLNMFLRDADFIKNAPRILCQTINPEFMIKYLRTSIILRRRNCQIRQNSED